MTKGISETHILVTQLVVPGMGITIIALSIVIRPLGFRATNLSTTAPVRKGMKRIITAACRFLAHMSAPHIQQRSLTWTALKISATACATLATRNKTMNVCHVHTTVPPAVSRLYMDVRITLETANAFHLILTLVAVARSTLVKRSRERCYRHYWDLR